MITVDISADSKSVADYAQELEDEDVIIFTSNKKLVAALVPLRGVDRENLMLSINPVFAEIIAKAKAEVKAGKTVSFDEIKQEFQM